MESNNDTHEVNAFEESKEEHIKILEDKGYDIEQFLCRCSSKTGAEIM